MSDSGPLTVALRKGAVNWRFWQVDTFYKEVKTYIVTVLYDLRGGAVWLARQAHNLKVAGSNPAPATNLKLYRNSS